MAWYSLFVLKVPLNNKQTNKQIVICVCRCRPGRRDYRRRWNCKGLPSRRQSHQQGLETSVILNVSDKLICCENVLWSETKFSNCLTGSCRQMCVVLLITFLVVSDLLCFFVYFYFVCIISICVYFCILCLIFFTVPLVRSWCYRDAVYSVFYFFFYFYCVPCVRFHNK